MPRIAASAREVITPLKPRARLQPSSDAPPEVVEIFGEIVRSVPANHFRSGDAPLIQAYAEAIALARQAAQELAAGGAVIGGRASPWLVVQEMAHRALAALSARLRLSPQHRATSRTAGRAPDGQTSIYETMTDE